MSKLVLEKEWGLHGDMRSAFRAIQSRDIQTEEMSEGALCKLCNTLTSRAGSQRLMRATGSAIPAPRRGWRNCRQQDLLPIAIWLESAGCEWPFATGHRISDD